MLKNIVLLVCVLMLCACTNVKWGNIQNSTDSTLEVTAFFTNKNGNQELNVSIKPEGHEIWIYDQSSFDSSRIDKHLKSIRATSENGCIITYDRDAIEKRIPAESWLFNIEQQDLNEACTVQGK